jgi:hypothetical protein
VYTHTNLHKKSHFEGSAFRELLFGTSLPHSTVMLRRLALEIVGTFNETLPALADYDLQLRIARKFNLGCIPQVLVQQRSHHEPFNPYTYDEPYTHRLKVYDQLLSEPASLQALGLTKSTIMADFILQHMYQDLSEGHPEFTKHKLAALHRYSPWRARLARLLITFRLASPGIWRHLIRYFRASTN